MQLGETRGHDTYSQQVYLRRGSSPSRSNRKILSSPARKNNPQPHHSKRKKHLPNLHTISPESAHSKLSRELRPIQGGVHEHESLHATLPENQVARTRVLQGRPPLQNLQLSTVRLPIICRSNSDRISPRQNRQSPAIRPERGQNRSSKKPVLSCTPPNHIRNRGLQTPPARQHWKFRKKRPWAALEAHQEGDHEPQGAQAPASPTAGGIPRMGTGQGCNRSLK